MIRDNHYINLVKTSCPGKERNHNFQVQSVCTELGQRQMTDKTNHSRIDRLTWKSLELCSNPNCLALKYRVIYWLLFLLTFDVVSTKLRCET